MKQEIIDPKKSDQMEEIERIFQDAMARLKKLHEKKLELIKHCRRQNNRLETSRLINKD